MKFCHCCLMGADEISSENEPLLSMKDNSFSYNNETITYLNGYLVLNNCSVEELFLNLTISDILICGLCIVQLESAHVFRELCQQAVIIWRSKYLANQKLVTVRPTKLLKCFHLRSEFNFRRII
jgi:hypothetical protein